MLKQHLPEKGNKPKKIEAQARFDLFRQRYYIRRRINLTLYAINIKFQFIRIVKIK